MIMSKRKAAQVANETYRRVHNEEISREQAEFVLRAILHCMSDTQYYKALEFFAYNRLTLTRF